MSKPTASLAPTAREVYMALEYATMESALRAISAIEPTTMAEAEVSPALFRKLNDALKLANDALAKVDAA